MVSLLGNAPRLVLAPRRATILLTSERHVRPSSALGGLSAGVGGALDVIDADAAERDGTADLAGCDEPDESEALVLGEELPPRAELEQAAVQTSPARIAATTTRLRIFATTAPPFGSDGDAVPTGGPRTS